MKNTLGPLECQVMKIIWAHGSASVCLVIKKLKVQKELAYTTVMTVMSRLVKKRILKRKKRGKSYFYTPVQTRKEFVASVVKQTIFDLIDKFGNDALVALEKNLELLNYQYINDNTVLADCIPKKIRKIL